VTLLDGAPADTVSIAAAGHALGPISESRPVEEARVFSVVVPVYRNEASLSQLLAELDAVHQACPEDLEGVFVVDGSPDRSAAILAAELPRCPFRSQLVVLSRNFGSFSAIRAGLAHAQGDVCGVMTADLQEPTELILELRRKVVDEDHDVALGVRKGRSDPLPSRFLARAFWTIHRLLAQREMPKHGADVFACSRTVRDHLLRLDEQNTSLIGLLLWLGFRRAEVPYERRPSQAKRSGWTFGRRVRYSLDSLFAFTDLPLRVLSVIGILGMALSLVLGLVVAWARLSGQIAVPGYAATVLVVMFFGALNSLAIGVLGEYVWRTCENTKNRPRHVVARHVTFPASIIRGGRLDKTAQTGTAEWRRRGRRGK
jgi:glycosyltransferase involved in cell wall biosynthesis